MPYDFIRDYLESHLRPWLRTETSGHWLTALHASDSGRHLGANLAIDLAGGAITTSTVAEIVSAATSGLRSIDDGDVACRTFAGALVSYLYGHSKGACPPMVEDRYAHVLKLSAALRFFFQEAMGISFDAEGLAAVEAELEKSLPFSVLEGMTLRGGSHGTVWVTSGNALRTLIDKFPGNPALAVRLALGLGGLHLSGPLNPAKSIVVQYPMTFAQETFQPRVCDASCLAGMEAFPYLSALTDDNWGRTWSMDGSGIPLPERIHRPVADL